MSHGFPSTRGSLGQAPPGDVTSPDSGVLVAGPAGLSPRLLSLCDSITGLGERGTCVDRAHSDLSQAFDFLPPDILIKTCIRRN